MLRSRLLLRTFAMLMMAAVFLFLLNRYLVFWFDWPDIPQLLGYFSADSALDGLGFAKGLGLVLLYVLVVMLVIRQVRRSADTTLMQDSRRYSALAAYIIRAAFWSVLLVGIVDATISLLRVEGLLAGLVGPEWNNILEQARPRGLYVHYPLVLLSFVIAAFTRSISFVWLSLLVILAEFAIVLTRFIFSYVQAFMGDLVRFWYAALFLFGSAYTLLQGGHVRVDLLYAGMRRRTQAWVNAIGSVLLGLSLCWVILTMGMGNRQGVLIAPVVNFEISQSNYGMYVMYLMAAFLLIFAVSMACQFVSYFLCSAAILVHEVEADAVDDYGYSGGGHDIDGPSGLTEEGM